MNYLLGVLIGFVGYIVVMVTYNVITLKKKKKHEESEKVEVTEDIKE